MKEIGLAITMLFNSAVGPISQPLDEKGQLDLIKTEIKKLEREIEWIDATDGDYAAKWLVNLRNKWAKEDSLELLKKYPQIKVEKQIPVVDTVYVKKVVSVIERPIITYDTIVLEPVKTVPLYVQKVYTVQPNDTLIGISKNFNISFSKLVAINNFSPSYKVKLGEKIKLVP
jgi:LysM repeat protein